MALTAEQSKIAQTFVHNLSSGSNLRVQALAGTGKTTTIRALSHLESRGIYLTFNRRAAESSQLKCEAFTWHAFAAQQMRRRSGLGVKDVLTAGTTTDAEMDEAIGTFEYAGQTLPARLARRLVIDTITTWKTSPDQTVQPHHVTLEHSGVLPDGGVQFVHDIASAARRVVETQDLPYGHDDYLHEWATMGDPFEGYEGLRYVFVDEAQDLPSHITAVLRDLSCTVVLVGDRFQYLNRFAGASLEGLDDDAFGDTLPLTKSFRFGASIAETANSFLEALGSAQFLEGVGTQTEVASHVRLTHTNAYALTLAEAYNRAESPVELVGADRLAEVRRELKRLRTTGESAAFSGMSWDEVRRTNDSDVRYALRSLDVPHFEALMATQKQKISTIHKFKGLEADRVVVDETLLKDTDSPEKLMLAYVASTRARVQLEKV